MISRSRYVNSSKKKTLYGHLSPKKTAALKPWDLVHIDMIVLYRNSIRQKQPGGAIIWNNFSLNCMAMIDPATGWFMIFEIPTYNLNGVTGGNDEYIDKNLLGLARCLTKNGYADTCVHAKSCLTTDLSLNENSLPC